MNTGDVVRIMREKRGYSQLELAKLVGYKDRSSVAKIEAGQVDLLTSKIIAFSNVLHVSPLSLIGLTDEIEETIPTTTKNESAALSDDELTSSIYNLLGQLTPSELEKAVAFVQGLLASH